MNINKKIVLERLGKANPHLTNAQAEKCVKELRESLLDVDDLMKTMDASRMRAVVSTVDRLIKELRTIMKDKEGCHLFAALGGGLGLLVGLYKIMNPVGRLLLLGGGFLMSTGFGIGADGRSEEKKSKLLEIQKLIEDDRMNFREMAEAIRRLDSVCQRYFKCSVLSEENQLFLESAVSYGTTCTKYSYLGGENDTARIHLLFRKITIAEFLDEIRILISKCAASSSVSAMHPLLAVTVQTLLFLKEVNDNEITMEQLFKNVAAMKKQCEIVEELG